MNLVCPQCAKDLTRIADVRYCNVCKESKRVPDPDLGDDWPITPELHTALFHEEPIRVEASAEQAARIIDPKPESKSVMKRKIVQRAKSKAQQRDAAKRNTKVRKKKRK